jgi:uncharacterized surface protein with fasciclin (FAS1) repeats
MSNKIKKLFITPLLLLAVSLLFVQCDKSDDPVAVADSLAETLTKSPDMSLLQAAIVRARLETFTQGPGPFTVFAPTDAAFAAAGVTSASIASMDTIALTALVLNHFQTSGPGILTPRTSFEIPDGPNAPMLSIGGFNNYSYQDKLNSRIFVSGCLITEKDIRCRNGIIHKINKVLLPPSTTVITQLNANPNYSLMVQAIAKAGLTTVFSPAASAPITVFAIPNSVMVANGYDATTIAALTGPALTTLTNILRYHVIGSRNFSTDLKAGTLKTLYVVAGVPRVVTVSLGTGVNIKGVSNPSAFQLTPVDLACSNGVVQNITGMLMP